MRSTLPLLPPLLPILLGPAVALLAALPLATDSHAQPVSASGAAGRASVVEPGAQGQILSPGDEPRTLRLLTFNVEHQMSAARFRLWQQFCSAVGWQDPIDPASGRSIRPEWMTYCNALDGTDGRSTRVAAPVHDEVARLAKRDALRALIAGAQADIVLLQEVSDVEAARELLGEGYDVVSSEQLSGDPAIAQNVAIGWRHDLRLPVASPELVASLSKPGPDGRRTRPGLAVTVTLSGGLKVALLNVHLKAGCRMGRLDEAPSREPERAERRASDCKVFQQQIPALEAWADRRLNLGEGVIIAGDFNRDLLHEIRERYPARNDGSHAVEVPADPARIASLLPEISDEDPHSAWFGLVRNGSYPKGGPCHRSIDQFLVSRNVESRLARPLREHRSRVLGPVHAATLDEVRASDHCPHLLELSLGQGTQRRFAR